MKKKTPQKQNILSYRHFTLPQRSVALDLNFLNHPIVFNVCYGLALMQSF